MANQNNAIAVMKNDVVDVVTKKIQVFQEKGELSLPEDYSPGNAMQSAWLKLQEVQDRNKKPALEVVTKSSVANALLDMVVQGLNVSKTQGYFIVYGNKLVFQRSYFGTMAVTKRVTGAKSIDARVIYEGDEVDYEVKAGKVVNLTHKQKFGNIDNNKIIGAYCVIEFPNDESYTEIMTMAEIRKSWEKSMSKGKGGVHNDYTQEMAKRTIITRTCKNFINSSDDSSLIIEHFKNQDGAIKEAEVAEEIEDNANTEYFDAQYTEVNEDGEIINHEEKPVHENNEAPTEQDPF